jgi:hypothetical protein
LTSRTQRYQSYWVRSVRFGTAPDGTVRSLDNGELPGPIVTDPKAEAWDVLIAVGAAAGAVCGRSLAGRMKRRWGAVQIREGFVPPSPITGPAGKPSSSGITTAPRQPPPTGITATPPGPQQ